MCVTACYVSFTILTLTFIFRKLINISKFYFFLVVFNFNTYFSVINAQDEIPISVDKEQKYLLPLLGYIHGYKIGQNFALQLPSLIL